jgi:hypothetical protein
MRDPAADDKRRDAMAMAAAPYLHSKLSAIDAKLSPVAAELGREEPAITVTFVMPERDDEGRRVPLTDVVRSCDVN